jgi:nucleoside-diphosphate-sugar epimerase
VRILVVGGAGYVGSHLVRNLVALGHQVRVLDRFYYGVASIQPLLGRIEVVRADMRSVTASALAGFDAVINPGGLSNDPTANYNPDANWALNYEAAVSLARRAKEADIPLYIFASSCSIYDRAIGEPGELLDETAVLRPVGHYCQAKYAAEQALATIATESFRIIALRKGTIHGFAPRMRFDLVVNAMVRDAILTGAVNVHGGGIAWRPLLQIQDAARAYGKALSWCGPALFETFNIVGENARIGDLASRVAERLRQAGIFCEVVTHSGTTNARDYRVSGEKAARLLGLGASVTVEQSVGEMVKALCGWPREELTHPRYSNIRWMELLDEVKPILDGPVGAVAV